MVKVRFKFTFIFYIFATLFLTSCFSPNKELETNKSLSVEDYQWIEAFFHKIMLKEDQIFLIEDQDLQAEWFLRLPEKAQRNAVIKKSSLQPFYVMWEKWRNISSNFSISKYLFVERAILKQHKCRFLFFINVPETFLVLKENYELFKRKLGKDFDPLTTVFDIRNERSEFWEIALTDDQLIGVLCGFGLKNASYYSVTNRLEYEEVKKFLSALFRCPTCTPDEWKVMTPSSFPIPGFISFTRDDEVVEKYKKEREKIKKEYRNKDFVYLTLEKLAS